MGNCLSRLEASCQRNRPTLPRNDDESGYLDLWDDESDGEPPLSFVGRVEDPKKSLDQLNSLQNQSTNPGGVSYYPSAEMHCGSLDCRSSYSEKYLYELSDQKVKEIIDYSTGLLSSSGWRKHDKSALMTVRSLHVDFT